MTVQTQTTKVTTGAGNGSTTTWSFSPLIIFASSDIVVTLVTTATGAETTLTEGSGATNYSVNIGANDYPATGSIIYPADLATPMPSTEHLVIKRVLTLEQQTDLENQGGYFADTQETQFDKLVMIDLQQQELLDRALSWPIAYTGGVDQEIPGPITALTILRLNAAGTALEWAAFSQSSAAASDVAPLNVSLSAAAAGVAADFSREDHVHLLPTVTVAKGGTGATTALAATQALSVEVGVDVQAFDADLTTLSNHRYVTAGRLALYNLAV
jgi:hypothetical protein